MQISNAWAIPNRDKFQVYMIAKLLFRSTHICFQLFRAPVGCE